MSVLQKIPRLTLAKESKFTLQRSRAAAGRQAAHDAIGRSTCQAKVEDLRGKQRQQNASALDVRGMLHAWFG